jgi:hypothetical protein
MRKSPFICFVIFFTGVFNTLILAQDNTARLTTLIGSHIEFNFNSIDKYRNGIRITDGTTLGVSMEDLTGGTLTGWHLDFQSFLSQPTIDGGGGNTLPLNTIQIEATDASGNLGTATFNGLQDLAIAPGNELMNTIDPAHIPADANTHQINLTYECGIANGSLLGSTADYYTIEVEVILIPDF